MSSEDKKQSPPDPGDVLWDRITDDIIERGSPCVDTVAELVEAACNRVDDKPPGPDKE